MCFSLCRRFLVLFYQFYFLHLKERLTIWVETSRREVRSASPRGSGIATAVERAFDLPSSRRPHIDKPPPFGLPAAVSRRHPAEESGVADRHSGAEGATAPETLRPMDRWVMTLWKAVSARRASAHRRSNRCGAGISQVTGQRGRRRERSRASRSTLGDSRFRTVGDRCRNA